jgi:hypothetical protein
MADYGSFTRRVFASGPVASAAANADASGRYVAAPYDGKVTGAGIIAAAAITGANTDSRTVEVRNRGQAGSGTTLVANKAFTSGVNAAADTVTALTPTATAADLVVAAGDILEILSVHVGSTGLAGPEFAAYVDFVPVEA